jgi:tRNA-dihydrouridine synthase C
MNILLAPMEGVVDSHMRNILTGVGGYTLCVTEFVRVVDQLLPDKIFHRLCPELKTAGRTVAGTPVIVQLLGAEPEWMASNANRAVELGAPGIDLNFGCPAKCVNKNNGGAALLKEPIRIFNVIQAVRKNVKTDIPVSAKVRLGFDDTELALDIAHAVQSAGADFITVHARTRRDGYKAPARWEWLARINAALDIPVIANGDINSVDDYRRCIEMSGCEHIMIGRGAVGCPDLAKQINRYQTGGAYQAIGWREIQPLLLNLADAMKEEVKERYIVGRVKQWLAMLKGEYKEAHTCFEAVRKLAQISEIEAIFNSEFSLG